MVSENKVHTFVFRWNGIHRSITCFHRKAFNLIGSFFLAPLLLPPFFALLPDFFHFSINKSKTGGEFFIHGAVHDDSFLYNFILFLF